MHHRHDAQPTKTVITTPYEQLGVSGYYNQHRLRDIYHNDKCHSKKFQHVLADDLGAKYNIQK